MNQPNTNFTTLALELHEALGAWCAVECGRTSFQKNFRVLCIRYGFHVTRAKLKEIQWMWKKFTSNGTIGSPFNLTTCKNIICIEENTIIYTWV